MRIALIVLGAVALAGAAFYAGTVFDDSGKETPTVCEQAETSLNAVRTVIERLNDKIESYSNVNVSDPDLLDQRRTHAERYAIIVTSDPQCFDVDTRATAEQVLRTLDER